MASLRERKLAHLRQRGAIYDDVQRRNKAALQSTRDAVRKMDLLEADPDLYHRYVSRTVEQKALQDAALADYMVAHPKIAEKLITEELTRAARKTAAIDDKLHDVFLRAQLNPRQRATYEETEVATLRQAIRWMEQELESLGINPDMYSSRKLRVTQRTLERAKQALADAEDARRVEADNARRLEEAAFGRIADSPVRALAMGDFDRVATGPRAAPQAAPIEVRALRSHGPAPGATPNFMLSPTRVANAAARAAAAAPLPAAAAAAAAAAADVLR